MQAQEVQAAMEQGLIQEGNMDGVDEEEFEQMQAALIASMADQEDIFIPDDGNGQAEANPGLMNQMFGFFGLGGQGNQNNNQNNEEEKKD